MCDHRQFASYSPGEIDHVDSLSEDIGNLYQNEDCSDIELLVGDEKFSAHKVILASRCEYFRAMLFGGMSESQPGVSTIELKDERPQAFAILLSYIYTGRVRLSQLKEECMLDLLGMANKYGFQSLEEAISEHLKQALSLKNVCVVYDMASVYALDKLCQHCLIYMDRNAPDVLRSDGFLSMTKSSVVELFKRSSFCASEIEIFEAAAKWSERNNDEEVEDIIAQIRFPLMSLDDLLSKVRPSHRVNPNDILDAIDLQVHSKDTELDYRGVLIPEENVASMRNEATVVKGEMKQALLDGDVTHYDLDRGFTRHGIDDDDCDGVIVKLNQPAIINTIKLLLWDRDTRSYAYYVEVSMDCKDWVRVVDHQKYLCRSWQHLHFDKRVVRYIKVVGTHNTVNRVFHVVALEALFTNTSFKLKDGLIVPSRNVATEEHSAFVIEGVSRTRNSLINGDMKNYDWDSGYTCHQLGSGAIVVQLAQPFIIDSMMLLLWDCDNRTYSYTVEVSVDNCKWTMIKDNSNVPCRSFQTIKFAARPVTFIRIIGTKNSANEVFHLVHFECPCEPSRHEETHQGYNVPHASTSSNERSNSIETTLGLGRDVAPPTSPISHTTASEASRARGRLSTTAASLSPSAASQAGAAAASPLRRRKEEDEEIWADLTDD